MATSLPTTLICGHELNDVVHLLTEEDRSLLKCEHCKITGNEPKLFSCEHPACADCVKRKRYQGTLVICPKCSKRGQVSSVTADALRSERLNEAMKEVNLKSKKNNC